VRAERDGLRAACLTVLGSGYAPIASGTWGSLAALLLFAPLWLGCAAAGGPRVLVEGLLVAGIGLASWLSVRWGGWAIARWGRADPKQFVLDEFAGQWVTILFAPLSLAADGWEILCVFGSLFLLFRVFDILKPPPARQMEALPAGWGILTDDLFAGLYANLAGQALWRLTPLSAWLGLNS